VVADLSGISTHILDTSLGRPAAAVAVTMEQKIGGAWVLLSRQTTDADGRVKQMMPDAKTLEAAEYRLSFATGAYFAAIGVAGLYPVVEITFEVRSGGGHYHIPLLLTANGYSTYRGS
jgi:5-hydroxyisourate hydrolase